MFNASPSELADLLRFSRARGARITSLVLAGEVVDVPLVIEGEPMPGAVEVRETDEASPPRLAAVRDGQAVGYVGSGRRAPAAPCRRARGQPVAAAVHDREDQQVPFARWAFPKQPG